MWQPVRVWPSRFNETDARVLGRTARGVRALNLEEDDIVVGMVPVMENTTVLTVSENGQGRRTDPAEYRLQSRGGKGIKNYDTQKNGPVAGVLAVGEEDDVILISDDGIIIRIPVAEISTRAGMPAVCVSCASGRAAVWYPSAGLPMRTRRKLPLRAKLLPRQKLPPRRLRTAPEPLRKNNILL